MEYIRKKYHKFSCKWDLSKCCTCCDMDQVWMCGRSLKKQLSLVSVGSIVISIITFLISMTWLIYMSDRDDVLYNNAPITAAHLIICLVVSLMSVYQFTISVMLLRQTMATEDDVFYYVLWCLQLFHRGGKCSSVRSPLKSTPHICSLQGVADLWRVVHTIHWWSILILNPAGYILVLQRKRVLTDGRPNGRTYRHTDCTTK
ncbi:uncharacterized protein [Choristoneura fumiferana]|uniref:uncharacterized protein n=1 Tax=Choristoneura fumiferana TaxID=7141 RepID=UPI003D15B3ED